ncbi:MAG: Na+/H+ antiporter NhaC family protein [Xanthomonadales bacterium]|nr:Na+/H+ antiporter NhaC family protein [Gammaproteobacteria bacterium]MBT8051213.1 Na+/H+ antiporter NhaC family protein [Gammaproteobacteria bacterium]MBT8056756.1 Na+/H+ antiporter NhaC family protein [Gammaproteobacteria bacterium]NNJ78861.1 Na+/H+ antiporter NhaC family protein [Xanthomonadales bacterium]NNL05383.1 Na+/H+ antiporter NhaC family protein [Xanthomonadales bacterium]
MPPKRTTRRLGKLVSPSIPLALCLLLSSSPSFAAEALPAAAGSWISLTPPLLAIVLALLMRQVIPALFAGVWLGAWAINGFTLSGLWAGLLDSFQVHILKAVANADHAAVMLFSLMIAGTVGIISRNGGMQGVVNRIVSWADNARHASLATASMGMAIFFDDYANTLVVGNTMRPVTDSMNVSRAKLAYIVDSTAAPVACIAFVTTWIGYEVGLIGEAVSYIDSLQAEAYLLFLSTIPYSFYPILAIAFVFMIASSGRDFGPMLAAERHAAQHGNADSGVNDSSLGADCDAIQPVEDQPQRALNAVLPILALLGGVLGGLYVTGTTALEGQAGTLRDVIGAADSYKSLMWGSMIGMSAAVVLTLAQRIMSLEEVVDAWYQGVRSLIYAMIILILAWALGGITDVLQTANFLVGILGDALPVQLLPFLVFVIAALTAFATGSSWGSMGILTPLVVPLTWAVMEVNGYTGPEHMHILYSSIASVLAGSVWGDHCSPISDTTILSSMASGCDHIEHVRTQLPYALLVGMVALGAGSLPVAFGLPWWLGLLIGVVLLFLVLRLAGKKARPENQ